MHTQDGYDGDEEAVGRRQRADMAKSQLVDCQDHRVVEAMLIVPRHHFVPPALAAHAYQDCALGIGHGQTISQPRLVAQMLELLQVEAGMSVLDVGCGSGYVAAVLAHLVRPGGHVYAIERQAALVGEVRQRLAPYASSVQVVFGDGFRGLARVAPFHAIHVAAACESLPRTLIAQLTPGGRMIVPLGPHDGPQELTLVVKDHHGQLEISQHGAVSFVPGLPGVAED